MSDVDMPSPANEPGEPVPPPELAHEVNQLLGALSDELLDEQGVRRLGDLIVSDSAVRRHYLRYVALHSTLVTAAGNCAQPAHIGEAPTPVALFDAEHESEVAIENEGNEREIAASPAVFARRPRWSSLAAASVLVALGFGAWLLRGKEQSPGASLPKLAAGTTEANPLAAADMPLAAEITYASPSARWQRSNDSYALTSRVRAGQTLALELGTVELTYASGTTLLLTGPSEFVVDANGGALRRGEIVARVTELGHGFTIQTPHGKIIDRGTAFGVVVDDFGVSEVNVFEGRVEAFPMGGAGPLADKIDLTTGRTLQWSGDSIISMKDARQGARPPFTAVSASAAAEPTLLLDGRFDAESFDRNEWTALGTVRPTAAGMQLDGRASAAERPYLITAREFSPSQGLLLITCDVRFGQASNGGDPSFSILTRSANGRGKPGTPWHDVLASGVRCSLTTDAASGEGMLQAGAKYEHDREPSKISWRGFARPQPDVAYHLEMRDDGLNVSFTATLADNPSVSKTVTCRSLFRGERNFVAFEGVGGTTVAVSNVRISQGRIVDDPSRQTVQRDEEPQAPMPVDASNADRLLKPLLPRGAVLRLAEDFETDRVDDRLWTTLGDVAVQDGQLQLGVANPEQHIDTWRQRPYLLTRREFTPSARAVAMTGRAIFAPNFLHGYGGSFAVLTRAEGTYGTGPGWEQSALRRAVRANFWPAALGQNRSLELFELLTPDPINLLATADFPVDPAARTYLFCVTDDGTSATLTFIDASQPDVRKTLTHATESSELTGGQIAFEGCWGAPVLLDDVRIYESPPKRRSEAAVDD